MIQQKINERQQLFNDVIDNKIPERVPVMGNIMYEAAIEYAGFDLKQGQWDSEIAYKVFKKINEDFQTDAPCTSPTMRNPLFYQILGAKGYVMSETGVMQHPEITAMEPDEYDDFIKDPFKFMCDILLPRLYTELDTSPMQAAMVLAKAFKAKTDEDNIARKASREAAEPYEYAVIGGAGFGEAPFDFLSDLLRSFTGISKDIRRYPDKVKQACDAAVPLIEKTLIPPKPMKYRYASVPLHMAPYLGDKSVNEFFWPSFEKLISRCVSAGQTLHLFMEQDWMRFLDKLNELPGRMYMRFEYGDPQLTKKKINKHIITGFYPTVLLQTETKQKCIDKAKELLDILAPDGGYIFNVDKNIMSLKGSVAENYRAVLEYVSLHGNY